MKLIRSVKEMQAVALEAKRRERRVALVPTMGALHQGHVALMRKARDQGAAVVVSIYVNPLQFGPSEDLHQYPRNLVEDSRLCEREEVDIVFAPTDEDMHSNAPSSTAVGLAGAVNIERASTWVEETSIAARLEGQRRPGHFRGVCTVVAKLFNIVQPDVAVFGQKDFQQLKVVQRMTRDLCYAVEIVSAPTVREPDGLAISSRNQFLDAQQRAQATVLWRALNVARDLFNEGERNAHRLETAMTRAVQLAPSARLDYAEIADAEMLQPVSEVQRGNVALIAAHIGKTRLIDNLIL
jgi:pantoate--beta-alanine ligase